MSIQEEIHKALGDIQRKVSEGKSLSDKELETLFLTSLIEEEG
jgi:hypothetical protein